jgi:hypothetical protein
MSIKTPQDILHASRLGPLSHGICRLTPRRQQAPANTARYRLRAALPRCAAGHEAVRVQGQGLAARDSGVVTCCANETFWFLNRQGQQGFTSAQLFECVADSLQPAGRVVLTDWGDSQVVLNFKSVLVCGACLQVQTYSRRSRSNQLHSR